MVTISQVNSEKRHITMKNEQLKIFDHNRNQIGVATRDEVHRVGYWHEAFHCWVVGKEGEKDYIYLQLRSEEKKDYPNLLDITAAGHLLADETIVDGVRELKEEIGIDVVIQELEPLGVVDYSVVKENFIDREIAHVFLYRYHHNSGEFILQKEEVSGMLKAEFKDFYRLWLGEIEQIRVQGFEIDKMNQKVMVDSWVGRKDFVPHELSFYQEIVTLLKEKI